MTPIALYFGWVLILPCIMAGYWLVDACHWFMELMQAQVKDMDR